MPDMSDVRRREKLVGRLKGALLAYPSVSDEPKASELEKKLEALLSELEVKTA